MIFTQSITHGDTAQVDDPQIGQASCDHQIAQALWIRQMTFMQKEPTAFLVGEEGFDLKTFFVPIDRLHRAIRNWSPDRWDEQTRVPTGNHGDRAIAFFGEPDLRDADLIVNLEEQDQRTKTASPSSIELGILGRATHIVPTFGLQSSLKFDPVKFSISQKHHVTVFGQDRL